MSRISDKRKIILRVASRLFADRGFTDVTMDDIAHACNFSKGTLYNYFRNKNDLICTLFEHNINEMKKLLDVDPDELDNVTDFIHKLFYDTLTMMTTVKRPFFQTSLPSISNDLKMEIHKRVLGLLQEVKVILSAIFQKGVDNGEFKAYQAEALAHFFMGMMFYAGHNPDNYISDYNQLLEIFFYGIKKPKG